MVLSCSAVGCKNRFVKGGAITFHSFPKNKTLRKIWEAKIRRANFTSTAYSKLCSYHFTSDSFDRLKFGGTWLKPDAIPTIFNYPDESLSKRKPPFIHEISKKELRKQQKARDINGSFICGNFDLASSPKQPKAMDVNEDFANINDDLELPEASDSIIADTARESSRAETTTEISRVAQRSVVLDNPKVLKAKFTSCRRRIKECINNIGHANLRVKQEEEQEDDYIARLKSNVNELRRIISNSNALQLRINEMSSQASGRTDSTNAREKRDIHDVETSMKRVESLIGDITADIKRIEESKLRMKDLHSECGKYVSLLDDNWKKESRLLGKIQASNKNKDDQKSNPSTSNSSKSNDDSLIRNEVSGNEPDIEPTRKRKRDSMQDDSDPEDIDVKPDIRLLNKSIAESIKISQQVAKTEEPQEEKTAKNMNYYITDTDKLATEIQKHFNVMDDVLITCRSFMNSLVKNVDLMRALSGKDTERSKLESNALTTVTNEKQ
ncbi:uncharacterized protein LOC118198515 isoform X2 [Stegodyphus dumicola]|uniref:uncharacterized protein LOC118198515 isoform X2 n=1 Tax=Stegodyphus dumicola TaxID=202533 RepID=UPI0015AEF6EE|nr:uncharacterized protein LOC118198515 isoform X2 [Stegodyphus dumicola]